MNSNIISIIIALCYLGIKMVETKFITKDDKPLKVILRDALIVYISALVGFFTFSSLEPIMGISQGTTSPNVFNTEPDF